MSMSRTILPVFAVFTASGLLATVGLAQVNVPAGPATPVAPAFTPPPPAAPTPPPAAAQPPSEPELKVPDLVKRDTAGKIIPLALPSEEAAVEALGIKPDQKAKYDLLRQERRAMYDRHLTKNFDNLMKVKASLPTVDGPADLGSTINWLVPARATVIQPPLSKMLQTAGIISTKEMEVVTKAVDQYVKAATDDLKKSFGDKAPMEMGVEAARFNFKRMAIEPLRESERLFNQLAAKWPEAKAKLGLSGDSLAAGEAALAKATDPKAKAEAVSNILKALTPEQAQQALELAWLPLPENRLIPEGGSVTPTLSPGGAAKPRVAPAQPASANPGSTPAGNPAAPK